MRATGPAAETATLAGEPSPVPGISRNVFVLSLVSFAADVSSEMLYPVLPFFLTTSLGAPVALVGVIEGVAEGTAGTSKIAAGAWSDRLPRRRPLVLAGYALSGVGKLLLGLSFAWPQALAARFCDRLGKGVRTAPRDALIADSSNPGVRGSVFGFHRALDTAGAVLGPLIGLGLVGALGEGRLRLIIILAVLPAMLSVGLVRLTRERDRVRPPVTAKRVGIDLRGAPLAFWLVLGASLIFALGNSSDVFLLLRAQDLGLGLTALILAYVVYSTTYALLSYPAGIVADRIDPRTVLAAGFFVFGLVYLGFASSYGEAAVWLLFAVYGLAMALTEGVGRAIVSELVPVQRRGSFLGLYHTAIGLSAVAASVVAGVLWEQISPGAPFALGAATGLGAAVLLFALSTRPMNASGAAA